MGSAGNDDNALEAATVMVCDSRVERGCLTASSPSCSNAPERRLCQMVESALLVDHFATLGRHNDRLFFLHLNK